MMRLCAKSFELRSMGEVRGEQSIIWKVSKLQNVLVLRDEVSLRGLSDLKPKKEMQETHVGHLKLPGEGNFGGRNVGTVATCEDKIVDVEDKECHQAISMKDVDVGVGQQAKETLLLEEGMIH